MSTTARNILKQMLTGVLRVQFVITFSMHVILVGCVVPKYLNRATLLKDLFLVSLL